MLNIADGVSLSEWFVLVTPVVVFTLAILYASLVFVASFRQSQQTRYDRRRLSAYIRSNSSLTWSEWKGQN